MGDRRLTGKESAKVEFIDTAKYLKYRDRTFTKIESATVKCISRTKHLRSGDRSLTGRESAMHGQDEIFDRGIGD